MLVSVVFCVCVGTQSDYNFLCFCSPSIFMWNLGVNSRWSDMQTKPLYPYPVYQFEGISSTHFLIRKLD